MNKSEIEKITIYLPQLIELVDCNVVLLSYLLATKTIGYRDECKLKTFANNLERSKALLDILSSRENGYKCLVEGLRRTRQTGALKILNESTDVEQVYHEGSSFQLGHPARLQICEAPSHEPVLRTVRKIPLFTKEATQLFTGRYSELKVLIDNILPDGGTASIIGIVGIGKTELAKMFLEKLNEEAYENIFKQIIWISCESSYTATTDLTNIARDYFKVPIFGSSNQYRDISSISNDIYEKLQMSKPLIILDNIETRETLQFCLPKGKSTKSKLSILTTTQNSKLNFGTPISLCSWQLEEAIEFVKKGLNVHESTTEEFEEGILHLVLRLEKFPLALSQAIGYIQEKKQMYLNYGPQDYLIDLARIPERVLNASNLIDLSSQGATVYKTLNLTVQKIESCGSVGFLASEILSRAAFMASENIPSSFFLDIAENDPDILEEALALMRRYFVIKFTLVDKHSTTFFNIHRLVQEILRIRISYERNTERGIHSVLAVLSVNLKANLIDHAVEAWKHAMKISSLTESFLSFPFVVFEKMYEIGRISDANKFVSCYFDLLERHSETEEQLAICVCLKAYKILLLDLQGKLDDSLQNYQATLNKAKESFQSNHGLYFKIRLSSASAHRINGKNDKAALICEELYQDYNLYKAVPLNCLLEIGQLQNLLKRFANSQETANYILTNLPEVSVLHREKLELETQQLIALNHCRLGNYCECIDLFNELLRTHMNKQINKPSDFISWRLFHSLGCSQYFAGLFEDAQNSYLKALNAMSGQSEQDCGWILVTKCNIALLMLARNKVDKALYGAIEAHEKMKQVLGETHFYTLNSLGVIGMVNSKIGRHADAVLILTQLVENTNYGAYSDDENKLEKYYLALSLEQTGNFKKAIEILNELRPQCLKMPNYKLCTVQQIDSILGRLLAKKLNLHV